MLQIITLEYLVGHVGFFRWEKENNILSSSILERFLLILGKSKNDQRDAYSSLTESAQHIINVYQCCNRMSA